VAAWVIHGRSALPHQMPLKIKQSLKASHRRSKELSGYPESPGDRQRVASKAKRLCQRNSAKNVRRRASTSADSYCLKTSGGPLVRSTLRSTVTSTRSAILINGMPLFIP